MTRFLGWCVRALKLALVGVLCALALLFVAVLALRTRGGRQWFAALASRALSEASGMHVELAGVHGRLPFEFRADAVRVADTQGTWLEVEHPTILLSPAGLLRGRLTFEQVRASALRVHRPPATARDSQPESLTWPPALPPVDISLFRLETIDLRQPVLGDPILLTSRGHFGLGVGGRSDVTGLLVVERIDGLPMTASVETALSGSPPVLSLTARLDEPPGGLLAVRLGLGAEESVFVVLTGKGPLTDWKGDVLARAGSLGRLEGALTLSQASDGTLSTRFEGAATGLQVPLPKSPGDRPWIAGSATVGVEARVQPGGTPELRELAWNGAGFSLHMSGSLDPRSGSGDATFSLEAADLTKLPLPSQNSLGGRLRLAGEGHRIPGEGTRVTARCTVEGARSGPVSAVRLEGDLSYADEQTLPEARLTGRGRILAPRLNGERFSPDEALDWEVLLTRDKTDGDFVLEKVSLQGAPFRLTGRGRSEESGRRLAAEARLVMSDLAQLPVLQQHVRSGQMVADLRAVGPRDSLDVEFATTVTALSSEVLPLDEVRLRGAGKVTPSTTRLSFDLEGRSRSLPFPLTSNGTIVQTTEGLRASFTARARDLVHQGIRLESLEAEAALSRRGTEPVSGEAWLEAAGLAASSFEASVLRAHLVAGREQLTLRSETAAVVHGPLGPLPLVLSWEGTLQRGSGRREGVSRLTLRRLQGTLGARSLSLTGPVVLDHFDSAVSFSRPLSLRIGEGEATLSGRVAADRCRLDLEARRLPMDLAGPIPGLPQGRAELTVHLEGPSSTPSGTFAMRISDLSPFEGLPATRTGPSLHAAGRIQPGTLHGKVEIRGVLEQSLQGDISWPVELSLRPFALVLPPEEPVSGEMKTSMAIPDLLRMLSIDRQGVEGHLEASMRLFGKASAPRLEGGATLRRGRVEDRGSGLLISDIEIDLTGSGDTLTLEKLSGTDGEGGRIEGRGHLLLPEKAPEALEMEMSFHQAKLLRKDDLSASVDGSVRVTGPVLRPTLSGRLRLQPVNIRLPDRLPEEIVEMEIVEVGARPGSKRQTAARTRALEPLGEEREEPPSPQSEVAFEGRLDLDLELPDQVFVRGYGLDSVWKGSLSLEGPARQPRLIGTLTVIRGTFSFAGKRFLLTQGILSFSGASPPAPTLQVIAEARTKDILARLQLSGPIAAPEILLSSEPALPPDEVLSNLLFGKNISKITPTQALQLAHAVQSLSSGSGGMMGRARQALGLDLLDFRQDTTAEGKRWVGIGKYLKEGVYVEVERGLGHRGSKVSIEAEIFPGITVESEVDDQNRTGLGLNWRKNY